MIIKANREGLNLNLKAKERTKRVPRGTKDLEAFLSVVEKQRDLTKCNISWQGNPILVVKTFGKSTCALCNRERMEIVKLSRTTPDQLINSCSKIHGACRHKPRFHRFHKEKESPSADEHKKREKVVLEAPHPLRRRINSIDTDGNKSVGFHHQNVKLSESIQFPKV
jgi:hypothetical protein